jgi:hypothetical protein
VEQLAAPSVDAPDHSQQISNLKGLGSDSAHLVPLSDLAELVARCQRRHLCVLTALLLVAVRIGLPLVSSLSLLTTRDRAGRLIPRRRDE